MTLDPATGYLQTKKADGFGTERKMVFVDRLRKCRNTSQICKSIGLDRAAYLDALVVDEAFRRDVNEAERIEGRAHQLNDSFAQYKHEAKQAVIDDLSKNLEKYK